MSFEGTVGRSLLYEYFLDDILNSEKVVVFVSEVSFPLSQPLARNIQLLLRVKRLLLPVTVQFSVIQFRGSYASLSWQVENSKFLEEVLSLKFSFDNYSYPRLFFVQFKRKVNVYLVWNIAKISMLKTSLKKKEISMITALQASKYVFRKKDSESEQKSSKTFLIFLLERRKKECSFKLEKLLLYSLEANIFQKFDQQISN